VGGRYEKMPVGACVYVVASTVDKWRSWQPLRFDGPSRPALLREARAGIELACTSCVMGFVVDGRGGGDGCRGGEAGRVMVYADDMLTGCASCNVIA
jgi:hypothetical protein